MKKISTKIATLIISTCCLCLNTWAETDSAKIRAIVDTAIRPILAEHDVPGMAVAIAVGDQTFFINYGVASREENTPVSENTLFEMGSVSKTFSATLFTYAKVLGKVSLDDHPSKFIPQLKNSAVDKANLLNLGTYTAGGLPLQIPDEVRNDQMIDYFQQWKPDFAPGAQRKYSNPSIGLFGHIAAIALQSEFSVAMEDQLFAKLGLSNTFIRVPESAMANYAWGYNKANQPVRVNPGVLDAEAYGVKSTAADMIRFVQANNAPGELEKTIQRAVEATHVGYFAVGEMVQGLGWEQYPYPIALDDLLAGNSPNMIWEPNPAKQLTPPRMPSGATLYNKTGSTNGFGAYVAFVPEKKIGVVILANRNFPIPARIKAAHGILGQLSP